MSPVYGKPWHRNLLELRALLDELANLSSGLTRADYDADHVRRWAIHRLWIAVGVEAGFYRTHADAPDSGNRAWTVLYEQRNDLAHRRLPDVNEDELWRTTTLRLAVFGRLVNHLLGDDPS